MPTNSLTFDRYREHIQAEASRFDAAIERAPIDVRVPACPAWDRQALRDHQAGVLAFWTRQLGDDAGPDRPRRDGLEDAATRTVDELAADLVARLDETGPDRPCWNWSGVDQTSGWVARRMAQEISVHRVDVESIAGAGSPIGDDVAIDGIDELLDVFVGAAPGTAPTGVVVELLDANRRAVLTPDGALRTTSAPEAWLHGTPSEVLLALWGRNSDARWTGDHRAHAAWTALAEFE